MRTPFLTRALPSSSTSSRWLPLLGAFASLHCSSSTADTPAGQGGSAAQLVSYTGGQGAGGPSGGTGALGSGGFGGIPAPNGGSGAQPGGGTGATISGGGGSSSGGSSQGGGGNGGSGASPAGGAAGMGGMFMPSGPNTAPGYMNLAPPMGAPLPDMGDTVMPAPPAGWNWYNIDGAVCRDGSGTGFYVHKGTADKLVIYLEGGGACSNGNFCGFNPNSANQVLAGDGQTVLGSALGAGAGRQMPGSYTDGNHAGPPKGLFDFSNAANPFKDWSQIYIPYCTGDVHFGTKKDGMVPGLTTPQQFVGYLNMQKFIGRIVPTFKDKVSRVVITGASAGGFGAALNYSMVQDAFGSVLVTGISDSGPPFDDKYMPVCMQKRWRDAWGFENSLPPDCQECKQADGGGLVHLADFLMKKHPNGTVAIVSSTQDEVIRLFYSVGLADCANYDTANPVSIVLAQTDPNTYFQPQPYTDGLNDLRTKYNSTKRFATYYFAGPNMTYHQHIFRDRFYDNTLVQGQETIAQFVTNFLAGKIETIGP